MEQCFSRERDGESGRELLTGGATEIIFSDTECKLQNVSYLLYGPDWAAEYPAILHWKG